MATFNVGGINELISDLEELKQMPDDVIMDMLTAAGEVAVKYQKQEISSLGIVDTGKLRDSLHVFQKRGRGGSRYVLVYPSGKHGEYNRKLVTKQYKRSKHGRTYDVGGDVKDVSNAEVGFIHEYGAPGKNITAKQWMRKANAKASDDILKAEAEIYARYLASKNL